MTQQGRLTLHLDSADGTSLDFTRNGGADKLLQFSVAFTQPFPSPPMVHLGVVGIVAATRAETNWKPDIGFNLSAVDITANGFHIDAQVTWFNCAASVTCEWLALER